LLIGDRLSVFSCQLSVFGTTTENRGWAYLSHTDAQKRVPTGHKVFVGTAFWLSAR